MFYSSVQVSQRRPLGRSAEKQKHPLCHQFRGREAPQEHLPKEDGGTTGDAGAG